MSWLSEGGSSAIASATTFVSTVGDLVNSLSDDAAAARQAEPPVLPPRVVVAPRVVARLVRSGAAGAAGGGAAGAAGGGAAGAAAGGGAAGAAAGGGAAGAAAGGGAAGAAGGGAAVQQVVAPLVQQVACRRCSSWCRWCRRRCGWWRRRCGRRSGSRRRRNLGRFGRRRVRRSGSRSGGRSSRRGRSGSECRRSDRESVSRVECRCRGEQRDRRGHCRRRESARQSDRPFHRVDQEATQCHGCDVGRDIDQPSAGSRGTGRRRRIAIDEAGSSTFSGARSPPRRSTPQSWPRSRHPASRRSRCLGPSCSRSSKATWSRWDRH